MIVALFGNCSRPALSGRLGITATERRGYSGPAAYPANILPNPVNPV